MTEEANWPDDAFSSTEIVELEYMFAQAIAEEGEPIEIRLFFHPDKARQYIELVKRVHLSKTARAEVLGFAEYVAHTVAAKLQGR